MTKRNAFKADMGTCDENGIMGPEVESMFSQNGTAW